MAPPERRESIHCFWNYCTHWGGARLIRGNPPPANKTCIQSACEPITRPTERHPAATTCRLLGMAFAPCEMREHLMTTQSTGSLVAG